MAYSTIPKPSLHFNTKLYTGNGSSQNISGLDFKPDFTWIKSRSLVKDHDLYDIVRGVDKPLESNTTGAEQDAGGQGLTSFRSDGFAIGNRSTINTNSATQVAWNWLAGGGQGSSNTDGSINTTYTSANTTSGFSIVKYTGTGANATVGHGLGVAPAMIIVKNLQNTYEWIIGHKDLASGGTGFSANWYFNGFNTSAKNQNATASWNSASPTTSVFSLHSGATYMNASGQANIAYCFAEKKGYSKIGSYTGNGNANGPFIYTGFKPAFVLHKKSSATDDWNIFDNKRNPHNVVNKYLIPNSTGAEGTSTNRDFLSNGFKIRSSSNYVNQSGQTFIYMAFAEEPLVANSGTDGVPATAR